MTTLAGCCAPIFGDDIVGYVTQNRGVTIHRKECAQLQILAHNYPERIVTASWGEKNEAQYQLTLCVRAINWGCVKRYFNSDDQRKGESYPCW